MNGIRVKLTELAKRLYTEKSIDFIPKRATDGSNGYDLFACIEEPIKIHYMQIVKIPLGVNIWLGDDLGKATQGEMLLSGLYLPRSSNNNLILTNIVGLLDSDYQGESFLKYKNIGEEPITINPGDRIGQLVIVPTIVVPLNIVESFEEVTERGEGGDGSTGV